MTQNIQDLPVVDVGYQSVDTTIAIIESAADDEILVFDFDETLFIRNSTEEYLNSLQPRFLGALLLFALSFLKPWKWLAPRAYRGNASRDWYRVTIATLLFPWTPFLWRNRVKHLADTWGNKALLNSLDARSKEQVIVASNGFKFIIQPVVQQWNLSSEKIIACRFWQGARDRKAGKLALVVDNLGQEALQNMVLVTDSEDDLPILEKVSKPCLTLWPDARYRRAMGDIYFPFFYTEKVKQVNNNYLVKVIVAEELVFLLLCISWLSPNPILHGLGMVFLVSAFWCIYEIGYMENDIIAETLESTPVLSESYLDNKDRMNLTQPWFWALLISIPGIWLLKASQMPLTNDFQSLIGGFQTVRWEDVLIDLGKWTAFLAVVRLTFWVYNRVNKPTRIWLYPVLQFHKCFGFLVLASTNLVGSMFFAAQTLARWICYFVYRYSKGSWHKVGQILRFLIFAVLIVAAAIGINDLHLLTSWQLGLIFTYSIVKATRELKAVVKDFGLITDPSRS